jgi:hypothetical protein
LDGLVLQGQDLQGQYLEDVVLEEPALEKTASGSRLPASAGQQSAVSNQPGDARSLTPEVEEPASGSGLPDAAEQSGQQSGSVQPGEVSSLTPEVESPEPEAESRKPEAERKPEGPLYWSASPNPVAKAGVSEEADQSHIPPMLRSLRKCEACGFPVSAGRMLCVECEEKKWRGQLRVPQAVARQVAVSSAAEKSGLAVTDSPAASAAAVSASAAAAGAVPEARAFAAAAPAQAAGMRVPLVLAKPPAGATDVATEKAESRDEDHKESAAPLPDALQPGALQPGAVLSGALLSGAPELHPLPEEPVRAAEASGPAFVLSAGMEPAPSWISANKYVLGVVLVMVGLIVLGVFVLR